MSTLSRKRRLKRLKKLQRKLLKRRIISISIISVFIFSLTYCFIKLPDKYNSLFTPSVNQPESIVVHTVANACETPNVYYNKPKAFKQEYYEYLMKMAENVEVDIEALLSIITTENQTYDINLHNTNNNGTIDIGLCQINSEYIDYFEDTYNIKDFDPTSPYDSMKFLAKHFAYLSNYGKEHYNLTKKDSYLFAAGAYNRGLTNECKYRNNYEYKEKFLKYYNEFSNDVK